VQSLEDVRPYDWLVRKRRLEIALGVLWFLDGFLQFQPFMFTKEFFEGILGMANMGLPGPVASVDYRIASTLAAHPATWNALFASLQVLIGVGLIYPRTARAALAVSIPWAVGVWTIGEGFGGLFMSGTSLLTGAPGAALLYAVLAVLLWPGLPPSVGERVGKAAWLVVWAGSALLELQSVNHTPGVPGAQIANGRFGEPGLLGWLDGSVGRLLGGRGAEFAVVLGTAGVLVGLGVLWPGSRRAALTAGMVIAVGVGVLGQDLGGVATGHGTDPGSGPVLVLLALALWPVRSATRAEGTVSSAGPPRTRHRPAPVPGGRSLVPVGTGTNLSGPGLSTRVVGVASVGSAVAALSLLLGACGSHHHASATGTTSPSAGPATTTSPSAPTTAHARPPVSSPVTHPAARAATTRPAVIRGSTPPTSGALPSSSAPTSPTAAPPARTLPPSTTPRTTPPTTVRTTSPPTTAPQVTVTLTIKNFAFSPASMTITAGSTVKVTNDDQVVHTWKSTSAPVTFNSNDLNPGASFSFRFTVPGTYRYECSIHTFMTGTITVTG
jgi:plastocyanin